MRDCHQVAQKKSEHKNRGSPSTHFFEFHRTTPRSATTLQSAIGVGLTRLWDVGNQGLGLLGTLGITESRLLQPILMGSGAPHLPRLWAARAKGEGWCPNTLTCLLGPLSLETHNTAGRLNGDATTWLQIEYHCS